MKRLTILGSTGSIGRSTLALRRGRCPRGLRGRGAGRRPGRGGAGRPGAAGFAPASPWSPTRARYGALREALAGSGIEAAAGPQAVVEAAARPADWTMAAIVGSAGLHSALAVLERGGTLALANKETPGLRRGDRAGRGGPHRRHAAAGGQRAQRHLPGARHQDPALIEKIVLTASGGPFRNADAGHDAGGDAGDGGEAPDLVDGRQDLGRQRHHDEQGPRADRGRPAVPGAGGADRGAGAPAIHRARHGAVCRWLRHRPARHAGHADADRALPGLADPDAGDAAAARPGGARPAGILRPRPASASRRCAWRGRRCRRAVAPPLS